MWFNLSPFRCHITQLLPAPGSPGSLVFHEILARRKPQSSVKAAELFSVNFTKRSRTCVGVSLFVSAEEQFGMSP